MVKIKNLKIGDVFIYYCPILNKSFLFFIERFVDGLFYCYGVNQSPTIDIPFKLIPETDVYTDLSSFCADFRSDFKKYFYEKE